MKKYIFLFLLASAAMASCKKDSDDKSPSPEVQIPNGSILLLKTVNVTDSKEVTYDSTTKHVVVTFPESYTKGTAEVKLVLHENVVLVDSSGKPATSNVLNYDFQGRDPLTFTLRDKEDKYAGY